LADLKRPKDIRAAPREWIQVLRVAYPFLRDKEKIGDLVLFGSQTLSLFMRNALRSKDLDFLSSQVSLRQVEALSKELAKSEKIESKSTTVQTRMFGPRRMTTYAVELRVDGKPFFVQLFDSLLDGQTPSILRPYIEPVQRWGLEIWAPDREATMALRLAFRQPEGITRLNAVRLNNFIQENQQSIRFDRLTSILKEWKMEEWVERNLIGLYHRNRLRIIGDDRIIPEIDDKLKS
jgi:hypothetical protein